MSGASPANGRFARKPVCLLLGSDTKVFTDAKGVNCVMYKAKPVLLGGGQVPIPWWDLEKYRAPWRVRILMICRYCDN